MEKNPLLNLVNSSGFIFQVGVRWQIERASANHQWKVLRQEHRWEHPEQGSTGFIDLIVRHIQNPWTMVIECKRATGRDWIFLTPKDYQTSSNTINAFWTLNSNKEEKGDYAWFDHDADPESAQSAFCIVQGQEDGKTPMLERIADVLLPATEALAFEHLSQKTDIPLHHFYFPVIVTNAILKTCSFEPEDVSMIDGKIQEGKAEFRRVGMVRFRKTLAKGCEPSRKVEAFESMKSKKEQTVLVINAGSLSQILEQFNLRPGIGEWLQGYIQSERRE